jgi:chromosome segregation ATPase
MNQLNDINSSLAQLEEELENLKKASSIIQDAKTTTQTVLDESEELNQSSNELLVAVNQLMTKINNVDFPTRLEKLDVSVTSINASVQNVLGRLDALERNLKGDIDSKTTFLAGKLGKLQRENYILSGLILVIVVGLLILQLFLK